MNLFIYAQCLQENCIQTVCTQMDIIVFSQSRFQIVNRLYIIQILFAETKLYYKDILMYCHLLHVQMMLNKIKNSKEIASIFLHNNLSRANHTSVSKRFMLLRDSWHDSKKKGTCQVELPMLSMAGFNILMCFITTVWAR